jgi:hypothetical protein
LRQHDGADNRGAAEAAADAEERWLDGLRAGGDQQHQWVMQGDERGTSANLPVQRKSACAQAITVRRIGATQIHLTRLLHQFDCART